MLPVIFQLLATGDPGAISPPTRPVLALNELRFFAYPFIKKVGARYGYIMMHIPKLFIRAV